MLWCVSHAAIPSFTVDLSNANYLTPAADQEACYDATDGEHCICGYNPSDGNAGCCTGTLQIDMGNGITGNFDYIGWDDQYNKPYYRTKACLRSQFPTNFSINFSKNCFAGNIIYSIYKKYFASE